MSSNTNSNPSADDWLEGSAPFALPEGVYDATVENLEDRTSTWGPSLRWVFRPQNVDPALGAPADFTVSRITSRKFSDWPKGPSRANEIIAALIGHKLGPREGIRKSDLIGRPCRVVLGINDSGYNTVERVLPAKPSAPAPKPTSAPEPGPADRHDEGWSEAEDLPFQ